MIYFDDVFYKEYTNTGKSLALVDRDGNEFRALLKEGELGKHYYIDDLQINIHDVCWTTTELKRSTYPAYCVHNHHVTSAKETALREDIRNCLLDTTVPFKRYFNYYNSGSDKFTIYAIANYDLRQENRSAILGKFVERVDRVADFPEHKLQGIIPSSDNNERVISSTVEAWRYRVLEWSEIREICPEFVEHVLDGQQP